MSTLTRPRRAATAIPGVDRRPRNPIEEAEVCAKVRRALTRQHPDWPVDAIDQAAAGELGLALSAFREAILLRDLGAEVRDLVAEGAISITQALPLRRLPESRRQRALAREAIEAALPPVVVAAAADLLVQDSQLRVRVAVQRARRLVSTPAREGK